ncbi:hypothetical protein ASE35_14100 [Lysobacter sp. Root916]|nr:hypothetical protein ASE35_14100 [Lysobacter sp. Root916]
MKFIVCINQAMRWWQRYEAQSQELHRKILSFIDQDHVIEICWLLGCCQRFSARTLKFLSFTKLAFSHSEVEIWNLIGSAELVIDPVTFLVTWSAPGVDDVDAVPIRLGAGLLNSEAIDEAAKLLL